MEEINSVSPETAILFGEKGTCKTSLLLSYACDFLEQCCEKTSFAYFISTFSTNFDLNALLKMFPKLAEKVC